MIGAGTIGYTIGSVIGWAVGLYGGRPFLEYLLDEAGRGVRSAKVRAVLEHQASRARIYFARAVRALPKEDSRKFVAAEIMRGIYWDLLRRIEAAECDVFSRVVRVPRPKQAVIALRTYLRN